MSPKTATAARAATARYDTATDMLSVRVTAAAVAASREVRPGIVVTDDEAGTVAGIEIRGASDRRLAADQDLRRLAEAA
ncbi:DUF2283 domain-containing protein [Methylobacterium terricola]|uniref:DUF2283 domain-containing protein n=1 Tax=Methylobacterium terricola TaxID=2583531 RepID=A0A5C4LJ89_9HYPH|nr:DUF2283 domain-containing protein [Methylobacterium terricola]TNC12304.1 DUF2283 domain-containing protein [Methylobacterium terricola]